MTSSILILSNLILSNSIKLVLHLSLVPTSSFLYAYGTFVFVFMVLQWHRPLVLIELSELLGGTGSVMELLMGRVVVKVVMTIVYWRLIVDRLWRLVRVVSVGIRLWIPVIISSHCPMLIRELTWFRISTCLLGVCIYRWQVLVYWLAYDGKISVMSSSPIFKILSFRWELMLEHLLSRSRVISLTFIRLLILDLAHQCFMVHHIF